MGKKYNNLNRLDEEISMSEFVIRYFYDDYDFGNMPLGTNLISNINKLTHKTFKRFNNPYSIPISFDYADDNPELVYTGKLLMVRDSHKNLGCYINPNELKKASQYYDIKNHLKNKRLTSLEQLRDYLPDYLLLKEIEPTLQILKDNKKMLRLRLIKNTMEKEEKLHKDGVFKMIKA